MPLHVGKGRSAKQAFARIINYVENPDKTNNHQLISSWQCNSQLAAVEFQFAKQIYTQKTGRERGADDVLAYHLRQSFVPGEINAEEANRLGQELAQRFTKGRHAYIVCTHIDKAHIHNHIIWNAVDLDATGKFRNFLGSAEAVRRLSDTLCIENGFSIIEQPAKRRGLSYNRWQASQPSNNLIIDIQAKLRNGKGPGYERWATVYNLKQMAQTLLYLQEHELLNRTSLDDRAASITSAFHTATEQLTALEHKLRENSDLQKHIGIYVRTREAYSNYRKAGYSKKFYAAHEAEIVQHKAAKQFFDAHGLKKLPTIRQLRDEYATLLSAKKALSSERSRLRNEMKELLIAKANIDQFLNLDCELSIQNHKQPDSKAI